MSRFIGNVSAYAYAVSHGYTGTEEEYAELMASYATVAEEAAESAESASASATSASASAQTATTKASEASQSATQAGTKASQASTSATQASASATSASQSASTATTKASEASASASTASTKASEASTSASTASSKASEASASATSAQTAQGLAESARDDAIDAKTDAENARDLAQQYADSIDPDNIFSAYATDTASGSVASFADGADDIPMKSVVVNIEPAQSGSGDPSPDNVRPISGWTGANVVRAGKNLLNPSVNAFEQARNYLWQKDIIPTDAIANMSFTDKDTSIDVTGCNIGFVYDDLRTTDTSPSQFRWILQNGTIAINKSNVYTDGNKRCRSVFVYPKTVETLNKIFSRWDVQIELGSTATEYEPYTGNTYPITFPTEAGTVYGGELDVTNGELTVDRAMVDLGTLLWTYKTTDTAAPVPYFSVNSFTSRREGSTNLVCSQYASASGGRNTLIDKSCSAFNTSNSKSICIADSSYTDAAAFKTAMDGVQLVYELATPITYTLTPTEIKSLLGDNNVWADAGDTEVTYRADTKLYIDKKLGKDAPMIATDNIVSGSYFMVGSNLYKATANIASGAAVVVGTNATAKTMAEALNEINA